MILLLLLLQLFKNVWGYECLENEIYSSTLINPELYTCRSVDPEGWCCEQIEFSCDSGYPLEFNEMPAWNLFECLDPPRPDGVYCCKNVDQFPECHNEGVLSTHRIDGQTCIPLYRVQKYCCTVPHDPDVVCSAGYEKYQFSLSEDFYECYMPVHNTACDENVVFKCSYCCKRKEQE